MPIPLALIPLIASGVGAASKGAMAAYQNKMANKVAKPRPTYTRPGEVVTAEALAANAYNSAGDTRLEQQAIDNSVANSAYQLGNSGNSSATNMAMIAALNANANRAKTNAVLEGRQRKDQLRGNYQQQLNNSAQYTDKEFQVNKFEPYQNAALAAQQLKSAAGKNMEGAIKDLIAGGLNAASGGLTSKLNPTIAGSLAKLLKKGDMTGAKEVVKAQGYSDVQAENVIKEIMDVTSPIAKGMTSITPPVADKSVPEFKTETDINSAATMLGVKPNILENALNTGTKEGLGSITNPDILSSVFHEGLDVEESNTILSEMLGKIQGLLDKNAISQEEFEQATAELTKAATVNRKKKDSKKMSNQVMKTIAPLASIINY